MNTSNSKFLQQLQDADMVLIGIGEEFNQVKMLRKNDEYNECRAKVENTTHAWLIPALNMMYEATNSQISGILQKFADLIAEKNYFVVSVSTSELINQVNWREKRLVMPCGGSSFKQCMNRCTNGLMPVTEADWKAMRDYKDRLPEAPTTMEERSIDLGVCPDCGSSLVLNNIYAEKYDENGYLEQWQLYTRWLQGTLNRKLLVLELGVGMQFPSVIRWPFEKVAFFNQKASFWRVNETLYHLSEELKEKGTSISQNAIDWLRDLC